MKKMNRKHVNIPVFIPHLGCPNQCVFCNQKTISGVTEFEIKNVKEIIESAISTVDIDNTDAEIAYFGGSFTGLEYETMRQLLEIAYHYVEKGLVKSIRLSTRPDYIDEKILKTLKKYRVKTIELGLQSASDKVLLECKRGHNFKHSEDACRLISEYDFDLVGQMMIGLPTSTLEDEVATAKFIVESGAVAARIYPTVVLQHTELKTLCVDGIYSPLSLDEAVFRSKEVAKIFINNDVDILRIGLCASENLVSEETYFDGPNHSALGELVYGEVYYDLLCNEIEKNKIKGGALIIEAPIGSSSKIIGQKRKNVERLEKTYGISSVKVIENREMPIYKIKIKNLE